MILRGIIQGRSSLLRALALGAFAIAGPASASAQTEPAPTPAPSTVERTAKGATAKDIRVGVYLNVRPDCTSGLLPAIRLIAPPSNGTLTVKRGKVSATNYKQCMALEVPGFIAFYRSKADFSGTDVVTIEIKYPQGRTEVQRITISVGGSGGSGRDI